MEQEAFAAYWNGHRGMKRKNHEGGSCLKEQFIRISRFIGEENVELLSRKSIAVAGVGAVGGYAIEMLVRCGIGNIAILDFDTVSESNINRQIIALHSTVGRLKTDVMKERIIDINPECSVTAIPEMLDDNNMQTLLSADIVLDCIDSVKAKIDLLEKAYRKGVPIISSMGAALRKDTSLIRTGDIMDTFGCPLAKQVRSQLRKRGVGRGIECVFSPENVDFRYIQPSEDPEAEDGENGRKRIVLGSLSYVTAIFGEKMAELALRKLLPESVLTASSAGK